MYTYSIRRFFLFDLARSPSPLDDSALLRLRFLRVAKGKSPESTKIAIEAWAWSLHACQCTQKTLHVWRSLVVIPFYSTV